MNAGKYLLVTAAGCLAGLAICCGAFAQGPINNAIQFQEKAVKTALTDSKKKKTDYKKERIKWDDISYGGDTSEDAAGSPPIKLPKEETPSGK